MTSGIECAVKTTRVFDWSSISPRLRSSCAANAVLTDHCRRGVEDHLRRSIVLFEPDDARFGEVVLEVEDVLEIGAAPLVDGLVGVADDSQVAVPFRETSNQQVLRTIRILILVDHHVLELAGVELPHLLRRLEQLDGLEEQVIEVERIRVLERRQVFLVDFRNHFLADVETTAKRVRPFHPVLGGADPRQCHPRRDELVVDVQLAQRLLDD
jgi:hypothetical protein